MLVTKYIIFSISTTRIYLVVVPHTDNSAKSEKFLFFYVERRDSKQGPKKKIITGCSIIIEAVRRVVW